MQYSVNPQPNTNKSLFFCKRLISTGPELNFILKKKQFARYYPHKLPENRNPIFVNNTKMSRKKPIKVQDNNKKLKKKRKKSPIVAPPKIKIREKLKNLM
ncbi:unnamed protein product [Meganyctiphanes norvegica]|uniref:Uncharacterized protein n=1 Tax=Meganyctiphanes norvegica TaxID=48144 RepID=A0AAV2SDX9_MEGNR